MPVPFRTVHTLVVGSGAAGLNAALQLKSRGIEDIAIVTEGLEMGTSINTGSDKQTYYKLSLKGAEADSPRSMAESYFEGGGMHGDLALVEAALSTRAFMNLVNLGVPFPTDRYGQFVGYKTDHDPRQRATSIGPFTSRDMCRVLIREVKQLDIPVIEGRNVVELLTVPDEPGTVRDKRVTGAIAVDRKGRFEVYAADNIVFATGGPGGLYRTSVYPEVHNGAIGAALLAGAAARNLPESQYGIASTGFRWNVSGTYMQVVPRVISTEPDGRKGEKEFLREYFDSAGEMNSKVFLKGYQWPFDAARLAGGSSIIDLLVYIETVLKGRRVFLDFRRNPEGFDIKDLSSEASEYLMKSNADKPTPLERLLAMNPPAVDLYREHNIDLASEPLEIAVCAQHNNGGLAADHWWESVNIARLFPVGEVNGSHGVRRPGGSALNSGQVGGIRAAEYIAARYGVSSLDETVVRKNASGVLTGLLTWLERCRSASRDWKTEHEALRGRMTSAAAHVRSGPELANAVSEAVEQWHTMKKEGCAFDSPEDLAAVFTVRQLCFAQAVYVSAIQYAVESGVGSRGSYVVLEKSGQTIHKKLSDEWRMAPENTAFREKVLETTAERDGTVKNAWTDRRPIPEADEWFESAWAAFREGKVYE
ncbi:MAG: FAD-binding protein [Kiritimatiellia bacterium]